MPSKKNTARVSIRNGFEPPCSDALLGDQPSRVQNKKKHPQKKKDTGNAHVPFSFFSMTPSNTSANQRCGKLFAWRHNASSTPALPRAANAADHMLPITYSACAFAIVAVIVSRASYNGDQIAVLHCPAVIYERRSTRAYN